MGSSGLNKGTFLSRRKGDIFIEARQQYLSKGAVELESSLVTYLISPLHVTDATAWQRIGVRSTASTMYMGLRSWKWIQRASQTWGNDG